MKSEQIKQITSKAIEELVSALNSGRSEALTNYLAAMSRFHRDSFFSVMLIARACPHATHLAGYQTWKSLGRYVKKGRKRNHDPCPSLSSPRGRKQRRGKCQAGFQRLSRADGLPGCLCFRREHDRRKSVAPNRQHQRRSGFASRAARSICSGARHCAGIFGPTSRPRRASQKVGKSCCFRACHRLRP